MKSGLTATEYVDRTVQPSTTYSYTVQACNSNGCSLESSAVTVTTPAETACIGVEVSPGTDIQAVVNAYPSATTFCLKAGVHTLSTGVFVKSYDQFIGEPGTILDGHGIAAQGIWGYGGATGQQHVTIRGIVFEDFTFEAVHLGWYWVIENNEMRYSLTGVRVGTGAVVRGNYIHHNEQLGLWGGPASSILIEDNELAYNNTSNSCGGACIGSAGGSKIIGSTPGTYGVTWRGNWVHHNTGAGIAHDGNVHNVTVDSNLVEENSGPGIHYEISWDAVISNNVARNNNGEGVGKSCGYGAQIDANTSQNVEIYGNTVSSDAGATGICLNAANRNLEPPFPDSLANVSVHHNTITMTGTAATGLVGEAANNIFFDWNTYHVPDVAGKFWSWYDKYPLTWSEFKGRGQEPNGTIGP